MPTVPADTRAHSWRSPRGRRSSFRPNGKLHHVGPRLNPAAWSTRETWAARFFIGFNVGQETRWSLEHVVELVKRVRAAQGRSPDASFIAQVGTYTHSGGDVVTEPGAQVILINTDGLEPEAFESEMVAMAEQIAKTFEQESVILEIQKNGVSQVTMGVEA
jgi:hypothetical protein